jgi:hypothetical protein
LYKETSSLRTLKKAYAQKRQQNCTFMNSDSVCGEVPILTWKRGDRNSSSLQQQSKARVQHIQQRDNKSNKREGWRMQPAKVVEAVAVAVVVAVVEALVAVAMMEAVVAVAVVEAVVTVVAEAVVTVVPEAVVAVAVVEAVVAVAVV